MSTDKQFSCRSFRGPSGDAEHFISITAPENLVFEEQLNALHARYAEAQEALGLKHETAVFRRFFVSDAINQAPALYKSPLFAESEENPLAVSLVQQPPLPSSKIALLAYHIESKSPVRKKRLSRHHMMMEKNGLRHLWSAHICCNSNAATSSEEVQTREVFGNLIEALDRHDANLKDHCVRTWLFIKDVDVFYRGMVKSRRELFIREGLTEDTHYIASTGIEKRLDVCSKPTAS